MSRPEIHDELLGRLRYDDQLESYEGETNLGGETLRLSLQIDTHGDIAPAVVRARKVIAEFDACAGGARDYAVEQLLDLKNDAWLEEGEGPLTPERFRERMELESVVFAPDGGVMFYHHDGGLFWGHMIEIRMDSAGRFVHADIPG